MRMTKRILKFRFLMEYRWAARPMTLKVICPEETDGDELVKGVEAKDRTFLKSKKIRDVIALLIKHVDNKNQLKDTIKRL